MTPRLARVRGFTLIELLVVISIITFLAAALVVLAMGMRKKALIQETNARLGILTQALTDYQATFLAFPPTATISGNANADAPGDEWWRWLTFTGGVQYLRPVKPDGTIVEEAFCKEQDLKLKKASGAKFPRDAWESDILYVFPVDNDVANLTPTSGGGVIMPVAPLTAALTYYHCALVSAGPDRKIGTGTVSQSNLLNSNAYENHADNADNLSRHVPGQ